MRIGHSDLKFVLIVSVLVGSVVAAHVVGAAGEVDALPAAETTYVQEPGDVTGIGVAASATLREWVDADEQVVVCLRSLTTILQNADHGPALAFLRELLGHCSAADAVAHVHLDPGATDERVVEGVRAEVDAVVELPPE